MLSSLFQVFLLWPTSLASSLVLNLVPCFSGMRLKRWKNPNNIIPSFWQLSLQPWERKVKLVLWTFFCFGFGAAFGINMVGADDFQGFWHQNFWDPEWFPNKLNSSCTPWFKTLHILTEWPDDIKTIKISHSISLKSWKSWKSWKQSFYWFTIVQNVFLYQRSLVLLRTTTILY